MAREIAHVLVKLLENLTADLIEHRFDDRTGDVQPHFLSSLQIEWLRSFNEDDKVYCEFEKPSIGATVTNDLEQPLLGTGTWRDNRPRFRETLCTALRYGSAMVLSGILIGALGVGMLYASWTACPYCPSFPRGQLAQPDLVKCEMNTLAGILTIHFLFLVNLLFVFGWSRLRQCWAIEIALCAFLLDIVYRALLLLFREEADTLRVSNKARIPLHFLVVISYLCQGYTLGRLVFSEAKKQAMLAIKLVAPCLSTGAICYTFFLGIFPLYNKTSSPWGRFLIASFSPVVGSVIRSVIRIIVQRLYYVNHPGTSFALMVYPYLTSALLFRLLQADLESLEWIALVGVLHGVVGVLERSTIVLRDHIDNQLYERHLAPVGAFRTPRSERLTADTAVLGMVVETAAIVASSGSVFLYTVLYEPGKINAGFLRTCAVTILIQVTIEWVFTSASLAVETHYQNMAVFTIWRKRRLFHCVVITCHFLLGVYFFSLYLRVQTNPQMTGLTCLEH